MIIKEFYRTRTDGINLYRSYSDKNVKIRHIGTNDVFDEAIDVENAPYNYEETDIPIETYEATETDYQNALEELGVELNEKN